MFNVELFEQRMREKNLMQKDIAEKLKISKTGISSWKTGVYPQAATLIKLCELLDVSADELLNIPRKTNIPSAEEESLLQHYRETDDRGKRYIQEVAEREALQVKKL